METTVTPIESSGPQLVSALPGRRRYRWPLLRRAEAAGLALVAYLEQLPGVQEVRLYPLSGSFVVLYDPARCNIQELERALTAWQPPTELLRERGLLPHRTHDLWGWMLLAPLLYRHLIQERGRPLRGERLGHILTVLLLAGALPLLRGALGRREPGPHALEILLTLATLLIEEQRLASGLLWLFHLPELALLARWAWSRIGTSAPTLLEGS
jgi:cation-transporting P-type ATPase C